MTKTLPPDPENMNDNRAAWAENALYSFESETGIDGMEAVTDLLCALMHLADRKGWDFGLSLKRAQSAYTAETTPAELPLLYAAKLVLDRWSKGDLAEAVRFLECAVENAEAAR